MADLTTIYTKPTAVSSPTTNSTTTTTITQDSGALRILLEKMMENRCRNATQNVMAELRRLLQGTPTITATAPTPRKKSEDSLAVVYIVFVMLFFAASLLVLLVKYLRRERESTRLQKFYEDYLGNITPSMVVHYDNSGRRLHSQSSRDSPQVTLTPTPAPTPSTTPPPTPTHPHITPVHTKEFLQRWY